MVCGKCSITRDFLFKWCGLCEAGIGKFSLCSLAEVTAGQIPASSARPMGIHLRKSGPKNSFSDFPTSLPKNIRNVVLEIRFPKTFGLVNSLRTMYVASRCNGVTNTAGTNA